MESNSPNPTSKYSLGELVSRRRAELGLTQTEVAERVGMSQEWVTKIETGRIKTPRLTSLRALADVLSMQPESLIVATGYAQTLRRASSLIEGSPEPEGVPAHLRTSFLKVRDMSPQSQKLIEEMIDRLAEIDIREFQDPKRGPDTEWPEDFDPDDKTPIKLPFPQ